MEREYLYVGRAEHLSNPSDRRLYRFLEVLPGALLWTTLVGFIVLSFAAPVVVAVFIIAFDIYWLANAFYLAVFVIWSFVKMRRALGVDWLTKLEGLAASHIRVPDVTQWDQIYHLVLLPMVTEGPEILGPALERLAETHYPKDRLLVVLATEARGGDHAHTTARQMKERFNDTFGAFLITVHPDNIAGEIAGKGSNETWAAKQAVRELIEARGIPFERVLVSSLDSDTQVYPDYFSCLTWHYLTAQSPLRSSFQPIPLFHNNLWEAPFFSRVAATGSTIWQLFMQAHPDILETFSSHSMPLAALVEAGFWNTRIVSEDSIIFSQCFLAFDGDYRVVPLHYPVSMDANVSPSLSKTATSVYRQNRRWAYGVEKIPYMLFGFSKNPAISLSKKIRVALRLITGFWAWACASILILALGWLPLVIGGAAFGTTVLAFSLPAITSKLLRLALGGLLLNAGLTFLLLPPRPRHISPLVYATLLLQWPLLPLSLIFFSTLPAIEAQTRLMLGKYLGFFVTEKTRRVVS